MENNLMLDWINDYIRGEIDYLKREEDICGFDKERYADMVYLENLTEEDINRIAWKIEDYNVWEDVYESAREEIYREIEVED